MMKTMKFLPGSYNQGVIFHTDLKNLEVRPIKPMEEQFWDMMMSCYHYLGFRTLVGESLKYIAVLDEIYRKQHEIFNIGTDQEPCL